MQYSKRPLDVGDQIAKLENRGLLFTDKELAEQYLNNISYYRLRAYTFPFQNNDDESANHSFLRNDIDFMDIIDLYVFDRRLRSLIFNELEKIEVAVRTKLSLVYSTTLSDAFWYENPNNFDSRKMFELLKNDIDGDVNRSNEDFIKHYHKKYDTPPVPPSWMTLEVVSFGVLSRMYKHLAKTDEKKEIALSFGIGNENIFSNWLHAFSNLRNCCAHHSRIWNRRYPVHLIIPYNTSKPFIPRDKATGIKQNKLFALLSAIKYIADIISPDNSFKFNLTRLLNERHKLLSIKEMGFNEDWMDLPVWR